jgi:nucleotide-binding universal stress UspA family protein
MPERVFNRILVATLGRPWSVHAIELAVRLAKADGLELVGVAVLTPGYVPESMPPGALRCRQAWDRILKL